MHTDTDIRTAHAQENNKGNLSSNKNVRQVSEALLSLRTSDSVAGTLENVEFYV